MPCLGCRESTPRRPPAAGEWRTYDRAAPDVRRAEERLSVAGAGGVQLRRADRRLGDGSEPRGPLLGRRGGAPRALGALGPEAGGPPPHATAPPARRAAPRRAPRD